MQSTRLLHAFFWVIPRRLQSIQQSEHGGSLKSRKYPLFLSDFNSNFLDRFNDKFKGTVLQRLAYVLPFWITRSLHYNSAYYIAQNVSVWRSLYEKKKCYTTELL